MATAIQTTTDIRLRSLFAWLPLAVMHGAAALLLAAGPAWIPMWPLAISIYAGFKWLTFLDCGEAPRASVVRSIGYLLLWPGMNAQEFLTSHGNIIRPTASEWFWSVAKALLGLALVFGAAPVAAKHGQLLAG